MRTDPVRHDPVSKVLDETPVVASDSYVNRAKGYLGELGVRRD
ncbi:hypothetical protein [Crossiella sp. SN42]|nr:hypothetical protein [Crossiella sp. SN42]